MTAKPGAPTYTCTYTAWIRTSPPCTRLPRCHRQATRVILCLESILCLGFILCLLGSANKQVPTRHSVVAVGSPLTRQTNGQTSAISSSTAAAGQPVTGTQHIWAAPALQYGTHPLALDLCLYQVSPRVMIMLGVCVSGGVDPAILTGCEANGR
jgi:hypothetical protein